MIRRLDDHTNITTASEFNIEDDGESEDASSCQSPLEPTPPLDPDPVFRIHLPGIVFVFPYRIQRERYFITLGKGLL